jgi:RNA polymerase sigma-70 factor, ECF subfamily
MDYFNEQLLKGLKKGDYETFELLFKEYYVLLCTIAEHLVHNAEDAEEIVSDVFFKLWNNKENITILSSVKGYLIKAVHNTAINFLQSKKNKDSKLHISIVTDNELTTGYRDYPLGQLYEKEIIEILNKGIHSLPKGCRDIFLLSRNDDLSYEDIAKKMNISVNTVKSQMKIALSRLRKVLGIYLTTILFFTLLH